MVFIKVTKFRVLSRPSEKRGLEISVHLKFVSR